MSSNDHNINFNIQIDQETELYRAIRQFSLEQVEDYFNMKDAERKCASKDTGKFTRSTRDSVKLKLVKTLEKIISNILRGNSSYHIAMRKEKVNMTSRYLGEMYKFRYRKAALDILEQLDFISQDKGNRFRQKQTVIYPSTRLIEYFKPYGVASYHFRQNELIVLRETTTTHYFKKIKRNTEYEDNESTNAMRKEVEEINTTLRGLDIQYPNTSSSSNITSASTPNIDTPYIPLVGSLYRDTTDNQIYIVFSHGSFDLGGRMYGGYWINLKKKMRQGMSINGSPCSEIDFSSMHIAQLYALDGYYHSDDYDAYDIPELLALGVSRDGIKKQTQRMINKSTPATSFSHCSDETIKREFKGLDYASTIKLIEDKHPKIAKHFYSGIGLKLANDEARIMIDVIKQLIKLNIPALPLHDALITQNKHAKKVQELMQERFFEFYGVPITAGIKRL